MAEQATQLTDEQAEPQTASEESPQAYLIMRISDELDVYQWIGDDWLPFRTFGSKTLLLADGWVEQGNGVIWLHLDLNGELDGWARLEESPLRRDQALSLPKLERPSLPRTVLNGPDDSRVEVTLLGASPDSTSVAVRFTGSDTAVWVDRRDLKDWQGLSWLPVYTGEVTGRWTPWRLSDADRIEVQVTSWSSNHAAWPGGPESAWSLPGDEYPVLGRSLDSQWLALRVDALEPPVVWVAAAGRELDFDPSQLPIFLSIGLEVVEIGEDGRAVSSRFAPDLPSYWAWRTATELLLNERDIGSWLWNLVSGETRKLSDRTLSNISPNGAYAVAIFRAGDDTPIDWSEPRDVALVSLEDGSEVVFESVHKPWGTDAPVFQQFWSADSKWLLSTVARYGDEEESTRWFALSLDGAVVEIIPPEGSGAGHWLDLQRVEQTGGALRYLNAEGEEIERPWSDDVFAADPPGAREFPELPDGWRSRAWSPDGRWLLATRYQETNEFDRYGLAALTWHARRSWGVYEIGIFDRHGALLQVFRGFGALDCGQRTSTAMWSPDGLHIVFGPRRTGCA